MVENLSAKMKAGTRKKTHLFMSAHRRRAIGFKALLAAMTRSKDTPQGSLIMQDHQFWRHFKLGAHSAEIYASFLQPDEGGMIRVRYQEWGTGYDNQTRLDAWRISLFNRGEAHNAELAKFHLESKPYDSRLAALVAKIESWELVVYALSEMQVWRKARLQGRPKLRNPSLEPWKQSGLL